MGKYNFSAQRFAELEARLKELEETTNELRRENAELRQQQSPKVSPKRSFIDSMEKYEMARQLFALKADDGRIIVTDDKEHMNKNFYVFTRNVLRAVLPRAYKPDDKWRIIGKTIRDMSDEEFQICTETLDSVIEILFYAKNKLSHGDEDT